MSVLSDCHSPDGVLEACQNIIINLIVYTINREFMKSLLKVNVLLGIY